MGGSEERIRDLDFLGSSGLLWEIYLGFLQDCRTFDQFDQEECYLLVGSVSVIGI